MSTSLNVKEPIRNIDLLTLQEAIEASRNALIITDNQITDNPIIYSNQAFADLTGYTMDEIIGKNCRFLQGKNTDPEKITQLRKAVDTGAYVRLTLLNYKKDGTPFWNDLVMSPVVDKAGKVTHFIGMQLDISEPIEAAETLAHKTEQLLHANQELEQFAYATSHDLQEPLRMISSYLQLLNNRYTDKLDDDAKTFLGFATEGAERLQDLINDLLILSRVTTTHDLFKPTDMNKVVERAEFNLQVLIEEQQALITSDELPELPVDAIQMTQLFQNLLSNGIKYRRPDVRPEIHISAAKKADSYEFRIADNGIGIDKKHHERIFKVFQRLHTRAEYEGNGVGLAICSKIVERHGGTLSVESKPGAGSTFIFSLPITRKVADNE